MTRMTKPGLCEDMQEQRSLARILETLEKSLHASTNHSVMVLEMFSGDFSEPELQESVSNL